MGGPQTRSYIRFELEDIAESTSTYFRTTFLTLFTKICFGSCASLTAGENRSTGLDFLTFRAFLRRAFSSS